MTAMSPRQPDSIPSERRWWLLAAFALSAYAIALSLFSIQEEDIFWHLGAGNWILSHGSLPPGETFVYTVPAGTRWLDVQWFFQCVIAVLWKVGGWNTLILFRMATVLATGLVCLAWLRTRGESPLVATMAVATALAAARFRFWCRPELLTFTFCVLQLCLYDRCLRGRRWNPMPLLLTQWIWGMWHSSVILGLGMAALFCAERVLVTRRWKLDDVESARWGVLRSLPFFFTAMVLATLLNPLGWEVVLYALTEGKKSYVLEFQPPSLVFLLSASGVYLAICVLAVRRVIRRENLFLGLVAIAFAYQATQMIRFFPYMALVLLPAAAGGWQAIRECLASDPYRPRARLAFALCGTLIVLLSAWMCFATENKQSFRWGLNESRFPRGAADFVLKENPVGNIYNEFDHGGYYAWRLGPDRRIFIFNDTKLNGAILERVRGTGSEEEWQALFREFDVEVALIPLNPQKPGRGVRSLAKMISGWKEWRLVFWDDVSCVFVKTGGGNEALIARSTRRIFPEDIRAANTPWIDSSPLQRLAKSDAPWKLVRGELERVMKESLAHGRAAFALGVGLESRGELEEALAAYESARVLTPGFAELHARMGGILYRLGRTEEGRAAFERATSYSASRHDALYNLAVAQYKSGDSDAAAETLSGILRENPTHAPTLATLQKLHDARGGP